MELIVTCILVYVVVNIFWFRKFLYQRTLLHIDRLYDVSISKNPDAYPNNYTATCYLSVLRFPAIIIIAIKCWPYALAMVLARQFLVFFLPTNNKKNLQVLQRQMMTNAKLINDKELHVIIWDFYMRIESGENPM